MNRFKFLALQLIFILMASLGSVASAQPAITSFTPGSGSIGTLISISGAALSNPTAFSIGGKEAIVISNDGNKLVGMVMPGATTGNISITNEGGTATSAGIFTVIPSLLPVAQQGSKLIGTGGVGTSFQGSSVSLSADGNTAIVGGYGDNGNIGAAWIYTRNGSIWTQQGTKLVGTGGVGYSTQGSSVSLSADGNTAIVGGVSDNSGIGAVWIYTRNGSTWTQQGSKLVGTGYEGMSYQGSSVSLSADGNTAIVSGSNDSGGIGAAWIYTRSGSTWTQQGSKFGGMDYTGTSLQGSSVSLSADGNTALTGGTGDNNGVGAVWAFSTLITSTTIEFVDLQKDLITVYPNPAGGSIIISGLSLITNDKTVSLMLTDISGKTILVKRLERNTSFEIIDISSFANGGYFLILQTDMERIVKRFIKQ